MGFFDFFKKKTAEPATEKPDFEKMMEEKAKRRDALYEGQRTEDSDYGFALSNPIITSTISQSEKYLNRLCTAEGERLTWERSGSFSMREVHGVAGVMVDAYQLYLNDEEYKTLFICPYGHNTNKPPYGMTLAE